MDREVAIKAAKWWGDRLRGNTHHTNGSDDEGSKMAGILADMMSGLVSNDTITRFEEILVDKILAEKSEYVDLYCDYHPDPLLFEAAKEAGINDMAFPWKTGVKISNGKVRVSDGYATGFTEI